MADPAAPQSQPPRRKRRIVLRIVVAVVLAIVVTAGIAIYLLRSEPAYVTQHRAMMAAKSPEDIRLLVDSAQKKFATLTDLQFDEATQRRIASGEITLRVALEETIGTVRTISLTLEELNAWVRSELNHHLKSAGHTMPAGVSDPGLAIEGENLVAFFRIEQAGVSQVVSIVFTLAFQEEGPAMVRVVQLRGGRLPVPAAALARAGGSDPNSRINELVKSFDGSPFDPVIDFVFTDGLREARVIGMKVHPAGIDFTIRIDAKRKAMKQAGVPDRTQ